MAKMNSIMQDFHKGLDKIVGSQVIKTEDYSVGLNGLPKSDVLKLYTANGSVVIRPSGTEPKLKAYISITAENRDSAINIEKAISEEIETKLN